MKTMAMTVNGGALLLVCVLSWLVLLPLLLIGGGTALFGYAVIEELAEFLTGVETTALDHSAARELAARLCRG